jgi:hypothetical protein
MNNATLTLSKEKGVNPRLTCCRRCGKDANELLLLGAHDSLCQCDYCGLMHMGGAMNRRCQREGCSGKQVFVRKIEDHERLPASSLCDGCEKEVKEHSEIVAAGGLFWRCADCKREGVIQGTSPLCGSVREHLGVEAPKPCGVEFSGKDCPVCSGYPLPEGGKEA